MPAVIGKTVCPVTREEFKLHATSLKISDIDLVALPREFSTGSLGWFVNQKLPFKLNGKMATAVVQVSITLVGSKELLPS
jgi:hypothetical protein